MGEPAGRSGNRSKYGGKGDAEKKESVVVRKELELWGNSVAHDTPRTITLNYTSFSRTEVKKKKEKLGCLQEG